MIKKYILGLLRLLSPLRQPRLIGEPAVPRSRPALTGGEAEVAPPTAGPGEASNVAYNPASLTSPAPRLRSGLPLPDGRGKTSETRKSYIYKTLATGEARRSGVTLILGLFILTAVAAVSFSLGALVLREIRSSRHLSQSEPALLSAEAGAETALFFRLRRIPQYNKDCASPSPDRGTLDTVGGSFEVCTNFYDKPYRFDISPGAVEVVMLIKAEDETARASGYSSVTVDASDTLDIVAYNLYPDDGEDVEVTAIRKRGSGIITVSGLSPATSYALFLIPIGGTVTGTICDTDLCIPASKGIPSRNPQMFSTGKKADLLRRLQIQWSRTF